MKQGLGKGIADNRGLTPQSAVVDNKSIFKLPVLILEDDGPLRRGLKRNLDAAGFTAVEQASSASEAWEIVKNKTFGLLLIDIDLGSKPDGLDFLEQFRMSGRTDPAIVVSASNELTHTARAVRLWASDYIVKASFRTNLVAEIVRVMTGIYNPDDPRPRWQRILDLSFISRFGLTPNDQNVLTQFLDGFPDNQILADRLDTTIGAAGKDIARVFHKLGLENRTQLAHFAIICSMFRNAW